MLEISEDSAAGYLRMSRRLPLDEAIVVRELAGGVSNIVLLVSLPRRNEQFVLKQARGRLRVKEEWLCPVERIWREVDVLRICNEMVRARNAERRVRSESRYEACVPEFLWEDRENFLYAMTAAPPGHSTWKQMLLAGETIPSLEIATAAGQLLATLHGGSWRKPPLAARFDDRSYFDQLRLDPYYRHVARVHPDLAAAIGSLLDSVEQHRRCLVHGDFSPKNILVWPGRLMLIDFEVGHYGDPAFDLGFFLTHLLLKSLWSGPRRREYLQLAETFWNHYRTQLASSVPADDIASLTHRAVLNLAGCMLARVDGKSPVEYLSRDQQATARQIAKSWLVHSPSSLTEAFASLER